jgi:hypothetical protein
VTESSESTERSEKTGKPTFIEKIRERQEERKEAKQTPERKAGAARAQHEKAVGAKESAMAWRRNQRKGNK